MRGRDRQPQATGAGDEQGGHQVGGEALAGIHLGDLAAHGFGYAARVHDAARRHDQGDEDQPEQGVSRGHGQSNPGGQDNRERRAGADRQQKGRLRRHLIGHQSFAHERGDEPLRQPRGQQGPGQGGRGGPASAER